MEKTFCVRSQGYSIKQMMYQNVDDSESGSSFVR